MDPHFLATLTSIGKNRAAYQPTLKEIKDKYFEKYRGGGEGSPASATSSSSGGPSSLGPSTSSSDPSTSSSPP